MKNGRLLIIVSIAMAIAYAIIIHILYSIDAPNEWFSAKWGAGEILTYASTVSLGLLAVWQNHRFKNENDKAQARLERIAIEANELNTIERIVEYQKVHIDRLRSLSVEFSSLRGLIHPLLTCNNDETYKQINTTVKPSYLSSDLDDLEYKVKECCAAIGIELKAETNFRDNNPPLLFKALVKYRNAIEMLFDELRKKYRNNGALQVIENDYVLCEKECITQQRLYIFELEKRLNTIIFGNLSLEEVRKMYQDG